MLAGLVRIPNPEELRNPVDASGLAGMVVFVLRHMAASLLVLPIGVLSIGAGLAWGLLTGVGLVRVGALLGAGASFWVGRWRRRDAVARGPAGGEPH